MQEQHNFENEHIQLQRKSFFPVNESLYKYLKRYGRAYSIPVTYKDLMNFNESFPITDSYGNETLWERVMYAQNVIEELNEGLTNIYALLNYGGDKSLIQHLSVDCVDYCTFGNSKPFRIKIINNLNDNYDYYYIKIADASRIYGLELEHLISPNKINYLIDHQTLVEEHIVGIPGDQFIEYNLQEKGHNEVRLAKEFVKFNERCLVRLLGDMRSYNFVIDMTPDFDQIQYRIRAIDFDQQCYEGKRSLYQPQFYKENLPYVNLAMKHLPKETVEQYQKEERALMSKRVNNAFEQVKKLVDVMERDTISKEEKIKQLKEELALYYQTNIFDECNSMGALVKQSINLIL